MNDSHLFAIARECSLKSDYKSGCSSARIGCISVYKNAILTKSYNSDKTHTMQAKYNKWRYHDDTDGKYLPCKKHAEIDTLSRIKYLDIDFSKVHLYIYRELKDGTRAMASCCPSCLAAIRSMGIKHIHYTTPDGEVHEVLKD